MPTTWTMQAFNDLMIRNRTASETLWPFTATIGPGMIFPGRESPDSPASKADFVRPDCDHAEQDDPMIMKLRLLLALLFLLVLLISGCSSSRKMPAPAAEQDTGVSSDPQVNAILVSSCYSCHSTGGSAPWYAAISPTYLAANSARRALNFSDWQTYDDGRKAAELKSIQRSVSSGSMPPGDYTALDHSARLTDEQKQTLLKWASEKTAEPLPR